MRIEDVNGSSAGGIPEIELRILTSPPARHRSSRWCRQRSAHSNKERQSMKIKTVGVVGGGLMGSGIAQTCAQAGFNVVMREVNAELLERGMERIYGAWKMLAGKGKITEEQAKEYGGRVTGSLDISDFKHCDFIIEAIIENLDLKKPLFKDLDALLRPEAIIVSNTSSLPIIEMAAVTKRPEQIAGLHFFNPAPVMKLVEVV